MTLILTNSNPVDPRTMGGKAAALAELSAEGLPIPPWFVIVPNALNRSLNGTQRSELASINEAAHLQQIFEGVQPSAEVVAEIENAVQELLLRRSVGSAPRTETTGPEVLVRDADPTRIAHTHFAVRSSAVDEDGADHSFAGQLESFLFVPPEKIVQRVAEVWRSGFTDRVFQYRREHKLSPTPSPPAVLVQQMIDAEVSGVAFAADPISGSRSTVVISAVFGLGTALVGGDADSDTYRLDRSGKLLDRKIAHKLMRHVADPASAQGVRTESLGESDADRATLDEMQLRQIVELVLSVSRVRGRPQDIEWAIAGGKLYLLQARPITSMAALADPDGVRAIWDNSNIAESYSGITTPLTFSFARRAYDGAYRQFCRIMKVPARVLVDNDAMFSQMLGLIRGRVYYNLLNWYRLLAMMPGYSVNQKFMEQMMGVREGLPAEVAAGVAHRTWAQRQSARLRLAWSAAGLIWNHLVLSHKIGAFYVRLNDAMAVPTPPLQEMRLDQLAAEFRKLESSLVTRWDAPLINDFLAMIFFGTLGKLCEKWCGEANNNLQNDLIADEGGIISTEPAKRINEMGKLAAADEELVETLCEAEPRVAEASLRTNAPLFSVYSAYLEKFGDRCLEELKLESITLVDDPSPLLRSIGQTARRMNNPAAPVKPFHPREAAEKQVAGAMQRHFLRPLIFRWVLHHARGRVRDRENLRFERTRLFGRVRRIFVEIGRRLHGEGLLSENRDVFYLTLDEILAFVEGTSTTENLDALAKLRRNQFEKYRKLPAPAERFETRGAVYLGNRFESTKTRDGGGGEELKGIGCCPGIVRGPVRVIRDPRGAHLRSGEILVAERTDPGWIMLFPAAAGILVERGSLLSHSAIVAREMGIPAVVSIPGLLNLLSDGQWVEMDGSSGSVVRIEVPVAEVRLGISEPGRVAPVVP